MVSDDRKRELCQTKVTLNGAKAKVCGHQNRFATVVDLTTGMLAEWSWEAVDRVVSRTGIFYS